MGLSIDISWESLVSAVFTPPRHVSLSYCMYVHVLVHINIIIEMVVLFPIPLIIHVSLCVCVPLVVSVFKHPVVQQSVLMNCKINSTFLWIPQDSIVGPFVELHPMCTLHILLINSVHTLDLKTT